MADNQLITEIEQALTALVKLLKAMRFYPEGHPSLNATIKETMAALQPMLNRKHQQAILTTQTRFSFGQQAIGLANAALPDLAKLLAERRVNQVIFLQDLPAHELLIFLQGLATPAEEIYRLGGLPAFLHGHRTSHIWLNEASLEGALKQRQKQEEEPEELHLEIDDSLLEATEIINRTSMAQQLRTLMELMEQDQSEQNYQKNCDKLQQLAPAYFEQSGPPGMLRILSLLLNHRLEENRSRAQRGIATNCLDRLLTPRILGILQAQFKRTALSPQQYQRLQQFIVGLGIKIAPQLLEQMSREPDSAVRKRLSMLLGRMGAPLLELLHEMVHNEKWYVVRNAVTLLGNLRLQEGIKILSPLTAHPDQRVRRALIRALAMIGGDEAVPLLATLTTDPEVRLRRPAIKALGATRSRTAVAPLLKIALRFDPFGNRSDIRFDAVTALGTLADNGALRPLLSLAKRPNILNRQRLEELRAEIILTLGKLGDKSLDDTFLQWQKSPHGIVRRAAEISHAALANKDDLPAAD